MEEALTQARDRMVVKVVVECVVGRVGALAGAGDMVGGMMLVTDAWAMVQAVPALEAHLECVAAPTAEQAPEVLCIAPTHIRTHMHGRMHTRTRTSGDCSCMECVAAPTAEQAPEVRL